MDGEMFREINPDSKDVYITVLIDRNDITQELTDIILNCNLCGGMLARYSTDSLTVEKDVQEAEIVMINHLEREHGKGV